MGAAKLFVWFVVFISICFFMLWDLNSHCPGMECRPAMELCETYGCNKCLLYEPLHLTEKYKCVEGRPRILGFWMETGLYVVLYILIARVLPDILNGKI